MIHTMLHCWQYDQGMQITGWFEHGTPPSLASPGHIMGHSPVQPGAA
jgi:hypothetical protein